MYAACRGGWFDMVTGRIVDALLGFPCIVLSIIIIVALESSPFSVAVAIAAVLTPRVARLTRANALSVRGAQFIEAARTIGAGRMRVAFRHLLPNWVRPSVAAITGYLGLGVPPPYPSWGRMIQEGTRLYFETAPWLVIFPGLALSITVVSFTVIADRLMRFLPARDIPK